MYQLQSRWRLEGRKLIYYGLRNREKLLKNCLRLSRAQAKLIACLPKELSAKERLILGKLMDGVVVKAEEVRPVPASLAQARFCVRCCANDYMIPGLEFDTEGLCPMCQTEEATRQLRSIVPLVGEIPRAEDSDYDVGLFYTGGKDSTYLLWYLAHVLGLRVLAMTWEIPFMSDSAKASIENAKKRFPNVTFMSKQVPEDKMRRIYRRLYELSENTCACPSMAYVLFYPDMVERRVPCFMAGNEPAQILGLYYNGMAPKIAYRSADIAALHFFINLGRVLTLRPPLKRGQLHALTTMRQLAYGEGKIKRLLGYKNELVDNIVLAIHTQPELLEPLRRAIRQSDRSGNIPAFVQLDFDEISGGSYDWRRVKETIVRECGWVAPEDEGKALHTSCKIEKCKEYSQFVRFYHCRSRMIPFSAIEMALAGRGRSLSREEAIAEIESSLGFSLTEVPECAIMREYLEGRQ